MFSQLNRRSWCYCVFFTPQLGTTPQLQQMGAYGRQYGPSTLPQKCVCSCGKHALTSDLPEPIYT